MLERLSIDRVGARLDRPFLMAEIASIGHHRLSVYSCVGAMRWHRHLDEDELFLGHAGNVTIETSWGDVELLPGYLVRIPKGLPHRSYCANPAIVLLVQTEGLANRRNGHQPPLVPGAGRITAVSVAHQAAGVTAVYQPLRLALTDGLAVSVQVCLGAQIWHRHEGAQLLLCHQGRFTVETPAETLRMAANDLVVVPAGHFHRVVAAEVATAVTLAEV